MELTYSKENLDKVIDFLDNNLEFLRMHRGKIDRKIE